VAALSNTPPATEIRAAAPRGGDAGKDVSAAGADREGDVNQDDVDRLLEQQSDTREAVDRLSHRVQNALRDSQAAVVELYGVAGNPGLSQQVAALKESHRSTRRELNITRRQIYEVGESLRTELRASNVAMTSLAKTIGEVAGKRWYERGAVLLGCCSLFAIAVLVGLQYLAGLR
jgi:hypothetical protein